METLNVCPICRASVEPFHFGNEITTAINCVRCGTFCVTGEFSRSVNQEPLESPHLYSGAIRELNERGVKLVQITDRNSFLSQVAAPINPLEMMDRFLISLSRQTSRADSHITLSEHDCGLAYAHDSAEWLFLATQMQNMGLLEVPGNYEFRITPAGYRRLVELTSKARISNQAFVAMNFASELTDIFNDAIQPALIECGYVPLRIDRKEHNEKIDDLIIAEIRKSGLVVADFTGQRTGVYFEAGFGLGLGLPVIWCCREDESEELKKHFDTRQYNHIIWRDASDLREKLVNRVNATAPAPSIGQSS